MGSSGFRGLGFWVYRAYRVYRVYRAYRVYRVEGFGFRI